MESSRSRNLPFMDPTAVQDVEMSGVRGGQGEDERGSCWMRDRGHSISQLMRKYFLAGRERRSGVGIMEVIRYFSRLVTIGFVVLG